VTQPEGRYREKTRLLLLSQKDQSIAKESYCLFDCKDRSFLKYWNIPLMITAVSQNTLGVIPKWKK
jgi:hypothetical protein